MKITNAFIMHLAFKDPRHLTEALTEAVKHIHIDKLLQRTRELYSEQVAARQTAINEGKHAKAIGKYNAIIDQLEDLIDAILLYEPVQKNSGAVVQYPTLISYAS